MAPAVANAPMRKLSEWLDRNIEVLNELGDLEFQRAQWVEARNPKIVASFVEAVEYLGDFEFDDLTANLERSGAISADERIDMMTYRERLRTFARTKGYVNPTSVIVEDPEWHVLCRSAQKIEHVLSRCRPAL